MEAEKRYQYKEARTIQQKLNGKGALDFSDNRPAGIVQAVAEPLQQVDDEKETLPCKFKAIQHEGNDEFVQRKFAEPVQQKNETGMPDRLKAGIEDLSGFAMDDVRVHYNSDKPAAVQALAYTQGKDIYVASGQERYLPHEAWHVVQQMAGHVKPTTEIGGLPVNDNAELEHEADVMGERASNA